MTQPVKLIYVLVKQVPDMKAKAGMNADGTIDRAAAKAMLNPFDEFALQTGIEMKKQTGGELVVITMGPPRADQVLITALEHGADRTALLTDKRLAGSDTLATAYALSQTLKKLGKPDVILCGLQTTDGDTAQVGPQIAERMGYPQITYVEKWELIDGNTRVRARRVVEGGYQTVECDAPLLMTVSNACHPLGAKNFKDVARVKNILKDETTKNQFVHAVDLDFVEADFTRTGLDGSPTIVYKTEKVGEKGSNCVMAEAPTTGEAVGKLCENINAGDKKDMFVSYLKK